MILSYSIWLPIIFGLIILFTGSDNSKGYVRIMALIASLISFAATLPLVLLAIPSVIVGYFTIGPMLFGDFFGNAIFVDATKHVAMKELAAAFTGPMGMVAHSLHTHLFCIWLLAAWFQRLSSIFGCHKFQLSLLVYWRQLKQFLITSTTWMISTRRCLLKAQDC